MAINNHKLSGEGIRSIANNADRTYSKIYIYSFSTNKTFSFNAFLTDFSDSYKSNWTTQEIYGRMDPIATFKNTYRRINCSVDVPSFSLEEAEYNLHNVDGVIQSLYPVYTKNKLGTATLSSPPLFRVLFSNFIFNSATQKPEYGNGEDFLSNGLLSYFEGFDFSPNVESGFFINTSNDQTSLVPKLLKATFSLGIIHEFPLGNEVNNEGKITKRAPGSVHYSATETELNEYVERSTQNNPPAAGPANDSQTPDLLEIP